MPLGGATVAGDLVFMTTFGREVGALSRADGSIVWTAQLPAGSNSTLAIAGDTLIAGAGLPLSTTPTAGRRRLSPWVGLWGSKNHIERESALCRGLSRDAAGQVGFRAGVLGGS